MKSINIRENVTAGVAMSTCSCGSGSSNCGNCGAGSICSHKCSTGATIKLKKELENIYSK